MKKICRIIGFVLACVICFPGVVMLHGCANKDVPEAPELLKDYKIVYASAPEYAKELTYAIDLQKQMKQRYQLELRMDTDDLAEGGTYDSESKEILIGHTNYSESQSAAERVTRLDYLITKSGNKIILMAGSEAVLENCVNYFLDNYVESADDEVHFKNVGEHLELHEYPHQETPVRIMSLNLRYAYNAGMNNQAVREPRIYAFVQKTMPDSIGVQECESFWRARLVATIGKLGYVPVQDEVRSGSGEYAFKNFIWYNPKTTKLVEGGAMWLSETPDTPSRGFGVPKKFISAGWAVFEDKETGVKYAHVNTHLVANADAQGGTPESGAATREKELSVLLKKVASLKSQGYQVFVTGDFNSDMTSTVYSKAAQNLSDARKTAKDTTNLFTFNAYSTEGVEMDAKAYKCIDFCFHTKDADLYIEKFDVVEKCSGGYMSDHNALVIDAVLYKR